MVFNIRSIDNSMLNHGAVITVARIEKLTAMDKSTAVKWKLLSITLLNELSSAESQISRSYSDKQPKFPQPPNYSYFSTSSPLISAHLLPCKRTPRSAFSYWDEFSATTLGCSLANESQFSRRSTELCDQSMLLPLNQWWIFARGISPRTKRCCSAGFCRLGARTTQPYSTKNNTKCRAREDVHFVPECEILSRCPSY